MVLDDQAENDWVANTFNVAAMTYGYWIGYTDKEQEGVWKTVAGEIATYTNWGAGEPNNYMGYSPTGENYAHMWGDRWNDLSLEPEGVMFVNQAIIERITPSGNANPFTVQAADETGTAFTVPAGKTQCTFTATGTWGEKPGYSYGPDGSDYTWPGTVMPAPTLVGALVLKQPTGIFGYVGASQTFSVTGGEMLNFTMNDVPGAYGDNSGALSVSWSCQ